MLQSLDPRIRSYIKGLETKLQDTESRHERTEGEQNTYQKKYGALEIRYEHLKEGYRLLLYKRFGRSSEKEPEADQHSIFEEA